MGAACILLQAGFAEALAQQPSGKRSSAPELTERQFETKAIEAKGAKGIDLKSPALSGPRAATGTKALFTLRAVEVAGATALPNEEIAASYRALLGKPASEADLVRIVDGITESYRRNGYFLTRAILSPQAVENGRVRVTVLEGGIDDIVLAGDGAERFGVRRLLQAVLTQRPLRLETLERSLLLVNDTPGVRIADVSIGEIGEGTGRFRLTVQLQAWRLWSGFDLDNRGSPDAGPMQAFLATALNSQVLGGEALTLNLATTPDAPRELRFGGVTLDLPVGADGTRLGLSASYSELWPDDERRAVGGRVQTESYTLSATIVPLRTRAASLWLTGYATMRNADETSIVGTVYHDRIRALGVVATTQMRDALQGATQLAFNLRQGIDVLDASGRGDGLLSRDGASGEFTKLHVSLSRLQPLSERWSLLLTAAAQAASARVLSSEAFHLGGASFGRAFRGGDVSGDAGLAGLAEVRFEQPLESMITKSYQLYAFVDSGAAWDRDGGAAALSSFGGGARLTLRGDLKAGLEIAAPIGNYSASSSDGGARVFFSLSKTLRSCGEGLGLLC